MRQRHAPGWSWRKDTAGSLAHPWAVYMPSQVYGLCHDGWHDDCPQAPNPTPGAGGICACGCHQQHDVQLDLFGLAAS